jgi:asparagine synthase (glutamine-hydrolysing)
MCGIAGKLSFDHKLPSKHLIRTMCEAITHRGPDDSGVYIAGSVGLGNRRLSIIDLSGGHQPICNEDETIWIVFNGEIYNFPELRRSLLKKNHIFKTRSDTEVIVHLYEEHGVNCLQHLNGMFAFAIWDEPRQRLFLARDRLGEKPLIYALTDKGLTFASEIQAVLQDRAVPRELDLQALDLYLTYLYIPAPWTIFKAIRKLPPAHYLLCQGDQVRIERYWQLDFGIKVKMNENEVEERVRDLLRDSVRRRLISDVPLGAFLSGGIDSSTIVALMSRVSDKPVRTFSVGFVGNDFQNNELPYARQVAERYNTQHQELWVRPEMTDILEKLVCHYGEPFGDGSAIPTYYISKIAREHVKVVLTGDGGDELFGGYDWYNRFADFDMFQQVIQAWRDGTHRSLQHLSAFDVRHALGALKGAGVWTWHLARMARDPVSRYGQIVTYYQHYLRRRIYTDEVRHTLRYMNPLQPFYDRAARSDSWTDLDQIFYLDHTTYLPDDILTKVDIASMACSLETRPPFLDHRLVEFMATLPAALKMKAGQTKYILRRVAANLLPSAVLERPKVGFGLPIRRWMQDDLYTLASDVLQDETFRQRELFNPETVTQMLSAHRQSEHDYGHQLYQLVVFELWARTFLDTSRFLLE